MATLILLWNGIIMPDLGVWPKADVLEPENSSSP